MPAALRTEDVFPQPHRSTVASRPLRAMPSGGRRRSPRASVQVLPRSPLPLWLKGLLLVQHASGLMTGALCVTAIAAYGMTVHTQRQLSRATATLSALQDQQQQLTNASAVFQHHLAEQAIAAEGATTAQPQNVIFLEVAPVSTGDRAVDAESSSPPPTVHRPPFPMGY